VAKAMWNGEVIAESDDIELVEGNKYFPRSSVRDELLEPSDFHTHCPWKGDASYFTLKVKGERNPDAVWYYPEPLKGAEVVTDRVAFWKGVTVTD